MKRNSVGTELFQGGGNNIGITERGNGLESLSTSCESVNMCMNTILIHLWHKVRCLSS